jgi:hypothetical protein
LEHDGKYYSLKSFLLASIWVHSPEQYYYLFLHFPSGIPDTMAGVNSALDDLCLSHIVVVPSIVLGTKV